MPTEIEAYVQAYSMPEPAVCRALREETQRTMQHAQMLVGHLEGAFLRMVTQLVGVRRVLGIGMFTGSSARCFAEALPEDGTVTTCEVNEKSVAVGRRFFAQIPHGKKIEIRLGPALDRVQQLTGLFDVTFIDADKTNDVNYFRRLLELVSPHGVIMIDNVLWSGEVPKQLPLDEQTVAIQDLNRTVSSDSTVTAVLLMIRDGVSVVRKRA